MATKRGPKKVTDAHKAAMATGRSESRAVAAYLEALAAHKPRRGRRRTPESVERRLAEIAETFEEMDVLSRLNMIQERMNLEAELELLQNTDGEDLAEAEEAFVAVVAGYSERKGITYTAWREVGVSAEVLRRAGVAR